jgi:nucleoid-associated protein YgaU
VVRGQSFWVVARLRLTAAWGSPTDSEVARYWTALIDANRDRLGDRRNPNLIYPGQELALPAPSAP